VVLVLLGHAPDRDARRRAEPFRRDSGAARRKQARDFGEQFAEINRLCDQGFDTARRRVEQGAESIGGADDDRRPLREATP
jgi:hypothetical protein